jgi:hypothetical protein
MHTNARMIEARLNRFVVESLLPSLYVETHALSITAWEAPGDGRGSSGVGGQAFLD